MSDSLSGSFYYRMEDLTLKGYEVKPSEYPRFDEEITYQNTLEQNIMAETMSSSTKSNPTTITNEIMKLREDINLLKQTIENQKDSFHEGLGQCNEEIRILKRKLEEEKDTEPDSVSSIPSGTTTPGTTTQRDTSEERRAKWRVSSAKLRQKKKQTAESLEQQAKELTQKNMDLQNVIEDLKEEASILKDKILTHMTLVHKEGITFKTFYSN